MFFREEYTLRDMDLNYGERFEFREESPPRITLLIWRPEKGENTRLKEGECLAVVQTEEPVSEKVRPQFENYDDPRPAVCDIDRRVGGRLHDFLLRVAGVLRWRRGMTGHPNPIVNAHLLHWSDDGQSWRGVPGTFRTDLEIDIPRRQSGEAIVSMVAQLVREGKGEPIGHELWREAWTQRSSLPRSSLLIGIAAAEVGIKSFIGNLIPQAEWLALHAPTPPLNQILTEYLPTLPVRLRISNSAPFVPKSILALLKTGVRLRNEAAHAGVEVAWDTLKEILTGVRDLLYLLDVYAGEKWAWESISHETRGEITAEIAKQQQNAK